MSARDLAAATPESRDRYVDFLRAASIGVVVLGHWLMAVVTWRDGEVDGTNLLALVPEAQLLTWVLQVMPVFFFVGGFANLVTWRALRRRGAGYPEFLHGRVERLVRPVAVLLAVWIPLTIALAIGGVETKTLDDVTHLVVQLLWFLGVYLLVALFAPGMVWLHDRHGWRALAALALGALAGDIAGDDVGVVNFVTVWFFAHQLGFWYADGTLVRGGRRLALALAGGGLAALVLLTTVGRYPVSMVGLPGERSNMDPPTICVLALTVWLVGLALLFRPAASRWLQRPRPWTATVALNGVIMTVFLWHLTALMVAVVVLYPLGFPQPAVAGRTWWLLRPVWFAVLLVLLAGLVLLFGRLERPPNRERPDLAPTLRRSILAAVGGALVFLGVTGFAVSGLADFFAVGGRKLAGLSFSPAVSLAYLVLGWALVERARPASRIATKPTA